MTRLTFLLGLTLLLNGLVSVPAYAGSFDSWQNRFRPVAMARGVEAATLDQAFEGLQPNPRVIELDRKQPEKSKKGFSGYLKNVMSQKRIDEGRAGFSSNRSLLRRVEGQYAVPAEVVVALWGVETSYGKNTGGFDLVQALATLAWEGRRAQFFENELMNALLILQEGHISREDFKGSWAGAMGQNQFMPSSWQRYAVDFDGDRHKDIWKSKADIFASTANYLHQNNWNPQLRWGWAIEAPHGVGINKEKRSYLEWLRAGVHFKSTPPSIAAETPLKLIIPDGGNGRAYLVTSNFDVIMTWNRSTYFALTVGLLSDLIAQGNSFPSESSSYNE